MASVGSPQAVESNLNGLQRAGSSVGSPQTIGSVVEYMCLTAFKKYCSGSRGEAILRRLLNKKFLMDVSDKENMQRFEGGLLGPVEKNEIENYVEDLRKRGVAHDGPDGIYIPALDNMGDPSEDDGAANSSEAGAVLEEAFVRSMLSRRDGISNTVQRTCPGRFRVHSENQHFALTEVPFPNGEQNVEEEWVEAGEKDEKPVTECVANDKNQTTAEEAANDENQRTTKEGSPAKRARYC